MYNIAAHSNIESSIKVRIYFVLVFALFGGWLLSFPFQGRILYSIMEAQNIDGKHLAFIFTIANLIGLVSAGFLVRNIQMAKVALKVSFSCGILFSLVYLAPLGPLWSFALPTIGFFSGICLASFGYFFHKVTPRENRFRIAADMLIGSNVIMISLNGATLFVGPRAALILAIIALSSGLILSLRFFKLLDDSMGSKSCKIELEKINLLPKGYRSKSLIILCLFIGLVTIDSGLMYSVITPSFNHLRVLSLWYWAVPYIAALIVLRNLPKRMDRASSLFIAISMIGFAFLAFMLLEKNSYTFLLVNTLMMGAFGVFDLFWWSILGEMLDEWENKARLFGIGLGANVLGIIIGETLAVYISQPEVVALVVVFVGVVILPFMNQQLNAHRLGLVFFAREMKREEPRVDVGNTYGVNIIILSNREQEILPYLLEGNTNKKIAEHFNLSKNTVKTHIKNIYVKLEVNSRTELLLLFLEKS